MTAECQSANTATRSEAERLATMLSPDCLKDEPYQCGSTGQPR